MKIYISFITFILIQNIVSGQETSESPCATDGDETRPEVAATWTGSDTWTGSESHCATDDTQCILRQLMAKGLIKAPLAKERARSNDEVARGEGRYNSKYRADCWSEENAPALSEEAGALRVKRGSYRGRLHRGYGRGRGVQSGPGLWETSYYLGDSRV